VAKAAGGLALKLKPKPCRHGGAAQWASMSPTLMVTIAVGVPLSCHGACQHLPELSPQHGRGLRLLQSGFGGDFNGPIHRCADIRAAPGQPPLAKANRQLLMHVERPVLGGHALMGADAPVSMGFSVTRGNQVNINLEPDTHEEADHLFPELSAGGRHRDADAADVPGRLLRLLHRPLRRALDGQLHGSELKPRARPSATPRGRVALGQGLSGFTTGLQRGGDRRDSRFATVAAENRFMSTRSSRRLPAVDPLLSFAAPA
jgi:hypothetical protein